MEFYPSIDINKGRVVGLTQGDFDQEVTYHEDPVGVAKNFINHGAKALHVVDLEAAKTGPLANISSLQRISELKQDESLKIQYGGGLRDHPRIEIALLAGADRAILGTAAVRNQDFVEAAINYFGRDKITVSIDAQNGVVMSEGWQKREKIMAVDLLKTMGECGVKHFIYTAISQDGTMGGPDLLGLREFVQNTEDTEVIYAGGISSIEDLETLKKFKKVCKLKPLQGVIARTAIYNGKLNIPEAKSVLAEEACITP